MLLLPSLGQFGGTLVNMDCLQKPFVFPECQGLNWRRHQSEVFFYYLFLKASATKGKAFFCLFDCKLLELNTSSEC